MENKKSKKKTEEVFEKEVDYSEGFGGIPDDADLTKNIGCVSNNKKTPKKIKWKEAK